MYKRTLQTKRNILPKLIFLPYHFLKHRIFSLNKLINFLLTTGIRSGYSSETWQKGIIRSKNWEHELYLVKDWKSSKKQSLCILKITLKWYRFEKNNKKIRLQQRDSNILKNRYDSNDCITMLKTSNTFIINRNTS